MSDNSRYYRNLRDQLLEVEKQGFNPYFESYERRIGQLPTPSNTTTPPVAENGLNKPKNISESYTRLGYADPFVNIEDEGGKINLSALSTGYNLLNNDPEIGVTQDQYVDYVNTKFPQLLQNTYGNEDYMITRNPDGSLGFAGERAPVIPERARFEKSRGKKSDVYLMFDEDTGKKLKSYDTEGDYKKDMLSYLESKNVMGVTLENVYEKAKELREKDKNTTTTKSK